MEFKDRIRAVRNEKGITQTQLAAEVNKGESAVRMWEIGRSKPDADTLIKLAEYFGCTTDYLLGLSEHPNKEALRSMEETMYKLSDAMSRLSTDDGLLLYKAFEGVVLGIDLLNVSPTLKEMYKSTLITILEKLCLLVNPIHALYFMQAHWTNEMGLDIVYKAVESIPSFILDASHEMQVCLTALTSEFLNIAEFLCHGKINGGKSVETTISALLKELKIGEFSNKDGDSEASSKPTIAAHKSRGAAHSGDEGKTKEDPS